MEDHFVVCFIKNGLYIPAFLIAIGLPDQMAWSMTALTVLMIVDFFTGISAAARVDGIRSITSKKMTAGALAKMLILMIPLVLIVAGKGIGVDFEGYTQGAISILILAEAYSNLGNIQSFRTGKRVAEIDAVSIILKKIRAMVVSALEKIK
ncbi:MAG: hypothetical protein HGA33_06090 [Candidatus Moranbacteria bacterium]|nr:hypothetical protein [Candidatus Moranbacteria bacterium]